MQTLTQRQKTVYETLKETQGYKNVMQTPRLVKVVINVGVGKVSDPKKIELIQDRLARITGQKSAPCGAKKSIASFKVREGDVVGFRITLRGERMRDFVDKLIHIAFPRTRDFRGLKASSIDELGNMTVGIPEHIVFPETADEEQRDIFGLSITLVSTARTKQEAENYFRHIGMPIRK
jgi:large subunit ribosomal protein L5